MQFENQIKLQNAKYNTCYILLFEINKILIFEYATYLNTL